MYIKTCEITVGGTSKENVWCTLHPRPVKEVTYFPDTFSNGYDLSAMKAAILVARKKNGGKCTNIRVYFPMLRQLSLTSLRTVFYVLSIHGGKNAVQFILKSPRKISLRCYVLIKNRNEVGRENKRAAISSPTKGRHLSYFSLPAFSFRGSNAMQRNLSLQLSKAGLVVFFATFPLLQSIWHLFL